MKRAFVLWVMAALLSTALFTACGVEDYNYEIKLKPPLGLKAQNWTNITTNATVVSSNMVIKITFYTYNDESYFSGYGVFLADTLADLTNESGSYRMMPNSKLLTNQSTYYGMTAVTTEPLLRTYLLTYDTITNAVITNITYQVAVPFVNGQEYWIHVKAYSYTYLTYSLPSNPTNVVFSTNI